MPNGYTGKTLRVDLSNQKIEVEEHDETFYRTYLGGRGVGYRHLLKQVPAGIDPFASENILVLATGAMTGSPLAASCRFAAVGKSPLTGVAGESEAAGFFGPELKKAGFDTIIFEGKSEKPVYLWVSDNHASLKDASKLAMLGAREVEDAIGDEMGSRKIRVAQTGLAGMNRVLYANITNNLSNFNGRGGFGALMGSKNVRAVAVRGTQKLDFANPEYLNKTAKAFAKTFRDNPAGEALYAYGTTAFPELLSAAGALPVNNFRQSQLKNVARIGGDAYNELLLDKRKGCYACPIRCKRGVALDDPKYGIDSRYGGPEYETIAALGSNLNITNLKAIAKGNEICNRYCMDTISAGMTMAFAFECYEEGIITKSDTGGLELAFGNADLMLQLLEMIAHREGFGDDLALGSARLAAKWGVYDKPWHLSVKRMEPALHDPRVKVGVGLGYAVCTYGADHMNAAHDPAFVDSESFSFQSAKPLGISEPVPATEISPAKIRNTILLERFWKVLDALGLCVFGYAPRSVIPINQMVDCVNAVTGWDTSLLELMNAGERSIAMARVFNSREGMTIKDDKLPKRLFDAKPDGPNAGERIFTEEAFDGAVKQYYQMLGLDPKSGKPLPGKLLELGLEWVDD